MKILFVSGFNLTHIGGGETWLINVANGLKSRHDVSILSSSLGKTSSPVFEEIAYDEYQTLKLLGEFPFGKLNRTGLTLPSFRNFRVFRSAFEKADIVYLVYFWDLQLVCLYLQFMMETPVVLGHHNALDRLRFDQSVYGRLAYRFFVPANIRLQSKFSAHHVLSDRESNGLLLYGAKNIFKIPNGVHLSKYLVSKKFDTFTLLFVGRLVYQKGVDLLPRIIDALNRRMDEFRFYMIGDGPLSNLLADIKTKGVSWLGFVPEDLKNQYLGLSHVLVAPSRHEAFMITALEALASGTPVVAFDIPGLREFMINGYNGFLVKSVIEMSEKVMDLYQMYKTGTYWDLVKNARTTAQRFDWSQILPQIELMLEKVYEGTEGPQ